MGIFDVARRKPAKDAPFSGAQTASARKLNLGKQEDAESARFRPWMEWQNDAWAYYDVIGEIKYGFGMLAASMSRINLFVAVSVDDDSMPISAQAYRRRISDLSSGEQATDQRRELRAPEVITNEVMAYAEALLRELGNSISGISGVLRSYTLNMAVAGECYLVKINGEWGVKSSDEIHIDPSGVITYRPRRAMTTTSTGTAMAGVSGSTEVTLAPDTPIFRLWREHPRYSDEPESSMMAIRESCDELLTLQKMIRVVTRANMNRGLLFLPDGVTAAAATYGDEIVDQAQADRELITSIYNSLTSGIGDETDIHTVVPNILTGSGSDGAGKSGIEWIEMTSKVDQFLVERADRALDRILQGIDMPKDYVQGMSNVRYSNAKNIDESLYKAHIEPMALMLVDALTTVYLLPALQKKFPKLKDEDLRYLRIWYDPSEIVMKADPADAADKGFDKFAISFDAWREAHGFNDTHAPSELEIGLRLLEKQTLPPEMIKPLFNQMLSNLTAAARQEALDAMPVPFPDSASQMLYGGAPTSTRGVTQGDPADILANPDDAEPVAASAIARTGLYAIPYDGNEMQERYRAVAEAAVRSGDSRYKRFRTRDLTPTQPQERSATMHSGAGAKDLPPIVIKDGKTHYLLDGHHRAMRSTQIDAVVVDIDNLRTNFEEQAR